MMSIPRRSLLRYLLAATATATLARPALARLLKPSTTPSRGAFPLDRFRIWLADYPALQSVEGSVKIPIPDTSGGVIRRIIVTRTGPEEFAAVDDVCTHAGCLVDPYRKSLGGLPCPCHGALFRPTGEVIRGPAVRPLPQFATFYTPGSDFLEVEIPGYSSVPAAAFSCTLTPNPATDWFELRMSTPTAGVARFRIINADGRRIVEWQQYLPADQPVCIRYPLTGFPAGVYWLSVEWGSMQPLIKGFTVLR